MAFFERKETPPTFPNPIDYKPFLRRDFRRLCAYCERSEERLGGEAFEVDHFRPEKYFPELKTSYSNLYYCCRKCNSYKSSKWPSTKQLEQGKMFADPCSEDPYEVHLLELPDGSLAEVTPCGEYTNGHIRLDRPEIRDWRSRRSQARKDLPVFESTIDRLVQALDSAANSHERDEIEREIELVRRYMEDARREFRLY